MPKPDVFYFENAIKLQSPARGDLVLGRKCGKCDGMVAIACTKTPPSIQLRWPSESMISAPCENGHEEPYPADTFHWMKHGAAN